MRLFPSPPFGAAVAAAALALAIAPSTACKSHDDEPPDTVDCGDVKAVSDANQLADALASAGPGTCVLATTHIDTVTALTVKPGVILVGSQAGPWALTVKDLSGVPSVTVQEGGQVVNVIIPFAQTVGIAVQAANARIKDARVTGTASAGIGLNCTKPECAAGTLEIDGATLDKNAYGVWANGGHVSIKNTTITGSVGSSIASGFGIIATGGAFVEVDNAKINKSPGVGVLVDGQKTRFRMSGGQIDENTQRGVWFQDVAGSVANPAVRLDGVEIARNQYIGVGGVASRGIVISNTHITGTVQGQITTDRGAQDLVGDGLSIGGGTTDLSADGVTIDGNERSGVIIDGATAGAISIAGTTSANPPAVKIVVQDSTANVKIAAGDKENPPQRLGVNVEHYSVPEALH